MGVYAGFVMASCLTLDATAVEAVEGGPVVLDVAVRWDGAEPIRHWGVRGAAETLSVHLPAEVPHARRWNEPVAWFGGGVFLFGGDAPAVLEPGRTYVRRVSVGADYLAAFPAGELPVVLRWELPPGRAGVRVERRVVVRLRPFTPGYAARVRSEVEYDLRVKGPAYREAGLEDNLIRTLSDRVIHTSHAEYARTAFLILAARPNGSASRELRDFIWSFGKPAGRIHDWYLDYLESDRGSGVEWAVREFGCEAAPGIRRAVGHVSRLTTRWDELVAAGLAGDTEKLMGVTVPLRLQLRQINRRLSDDRLARLTRIDNLWVRAFTAMCLRDRLDPAWAARVNRDLMARYAPLPPAESARLLADLTGGRPSARAAAETALAKNAYRLRPELEDALEVARDQDARDRPTRILVARPQTPDDKAEAEYLSHLECYDFPAGRASLATIAAGHETIPAVIRARAILARRSALGG